MTSVKEKLEENILNKFINKQIFVELSINHEPDTLEKHLINLISKIVTEFHKLRMHHICKLTVNENNQNYIRSFYNKLVLFKGQ